MRSDDLEAVLTAARGLQGRVACLTVLCERGDAVTPERIGDLWRAACAAAHVADAQFRDIRAKVATDADVRRSQRDPAAWPRQRAQRPVSTCAREAYREKSHRSS